MKKIALLLALVLLLGCFAGCGKKNNVAGEPSESTPYEGEYDHAHGPNDGHIFEAEIMSEPDCVTNGEIVYMCPICGEGYTETVPAYGHEFEPATCDQNGYCLNCGALGEQKLGHLAKDGICERCRAVVE